MHACQVSGVLRGSCLLGGAVALCRGRLLQHLLRALGQERLPLPLRLRVVQRSQVSQTAWEWACCITHPAEQVPASSHPLSNPCTDTNLGRQTSKVQCAGCQHVSYRRNHPCQASSNMHSKSKCAKIELRTAMGQQGAGECSTHLLCGGCLCRKALLRLQWGLHLSLKLGICRAAGKSLQRIHTPSMLEKIFHNP